MKADTEAKASPAERLMALFAGSETAHGTHGVPVKDGLKMVIKTTARTLRGPATLSLWEQHIAGKRPLGVIPIRAHGTCNWGSIDLDKYDANLLEVVERVEAAKLPLVPCVSKSGGLHLFLFLDEAAPAGDVLAALGRAAAALGMAGCEIFPKQTVLVGDSVGNWMVMPYYGGDFGGKLKMQCGLKKTGAEMTVGEFVAFAEGRRTTLDKFVVKPAPPKAAVSSSGDFSDGPPCLQHMAMEGFPADGRKRALFMMALFYKRSNLSGWEAQLDAANHKFFPIPLPSDEVAGVIKSVRKKTYEYTCREEPMRSVCDSGLCRTRPFGVGGGDSANFPVFEKLEIRQGDEGDETTWTITMLGGKTIRLTSDEVYEQKVFNKRCLAKFGKCFHLMKANAWSDFLCQAAVGVKPSQEPAIVGQVGQFHELLEEFLTNRARGERMEDVLSGRPFEEDNGRHWFTLRSLTKYLRQESDRFRHKSPMKIAALIRDKRIGGGSQSKKIGPKTVRLFWVPSSCVEATPLLEPPPIKDDDVF